MGNSGQFPCKSCAPRAAAKLELIGTSAPGSPKTGQKGHSKQPISIQVTAKKRPNYRNSAGKHIRLHDSPARPNSTGTNPSKKAKNQSFLTLLLLVWNILNDMGLMGIRKVCLEALIPFVPSCPPDASTKRHHGPTSAHFQYVYSSDQFHDIISPPGIIPSVPIDGLPFRNVSHRFQSQRPPGPSVSRPRAWCLLP